MTVKYSICMVNLDMEDYLQSSILSIANQLDENYEIIVVDGGSNDKSLSRLEELKSLVSCLSVYSLPRDNLRKLGEDRNYSIRKATGEYVLLHLDCDDLYGPFINDWVKIFHLVEKVKGCDVLVAGKHINMAKKSFLLKHGPYKNLNYEDRELWNRLDVQGKFYSLDHRDFVIRMKLNLLKRLKKIFVRTFNEIKENLRWPHSNILSYILVEIKNKKNKKLHQFMLRISILPISYICAKIEGNIQEDNVTIKGYERVSPMKISELLIQNSFEVSEELKSIVNSKFFK